MKTNAVFVFLVVAMFSVPAYSAIVTVIAEGVFSEYIDPDSLLPFAEPAPGTIFKIEFTYDSDTPDIASDLSDTGVYLDAISDMSLKIGNDIFGIREVNHIIVGDDSFNSTSGDTSDFWAARTLSYTPTGTPDIETREEFLIVLWTALPSTPVPPLSSDALITPSWPSDWDFGEVRYAIWLDGPDSSELLASATASITSLTATMIPLPAAVWLFGSALGLLGWIRHKRT